MPSASPASAIGLLVAGALCLLPFLVPYHQQPILSFFPEWLAGALGAAALLARVANRGASTIGLPVAARWLTAFGLFLFVRAAIGGLAYPSACVLAAIYVLYAAALVWLGAQLVADLGLERVAVLLAAFLLAGALANAAAGVVQYYGRPAFLEDVVADLHGPGAYGNIAQRNLYANYLALGESALALLWQRGRVRTGWALAALALLAWGTVLSGSRSALVYALWLTALGLTVARLHGGAEARGLRVAACSIGGATLAGIFALPLVNQLFLLGAPGTGALDRVYAYAGEPVRAKAAALALQVFVGAPWIGVGPGEFAGAAFEAGIDPAMASVGEVWTSPHNLPLHLLAETGAIGTLLALGGLCLWGWRAARRYRGDPQLALWWLLAAAGVELIHSFIEFPLWSAHFLGVTALLVGASSEARHSFVTPWATRLGLAAFCAALSLVLAMLLRDYIRLDRARVTGTAFTLAPASQVREDAATMRELTHGLMAPVAELWIMLGARLDRVDLSEKRDMSARLARHWPAHDVIVRQAAFLALDGQAEKARVTLGRALRTYPDRREAALTILGQAYPADPAAIDPLLATARKTQR